MCLVHLITAYKITEYLHRTHTQEYTQHGRGKEWRECETCDMHVPLRTHHCGHCGRCIYALDHHCYFLGHCVGRFNLR